jgi:hypothetical protein
MEVRSWHHTLTCGFFHSSNLRGDFEKIILFYYRKEALKMPKNPLLSFARKVDAKLITPLDDIGRRMRGKLTNAEQNEIGLKEMRRVYHESQLEFRLRELNRNSVTPGGVPTPKPSIR